MAEVEEKTNGSGDAANQTKEQVYSAENLKSIEQKVEELKVSDNQVSDSAETADDGLDVEETEEGKEPRQVVIRGVKGKVKWFNVARGYGFIERNDNEQDVFLHQSAVVRRGRKPRYSLYLKGGEDVEFDVVEGVKGLEAAAVSAPDGMELFTVNPRPQHGRKAPTEERNRNPERANQRRPFRQRFKGRKNYRKQSGSGQMNGDESDPEMAARRRDNDESDDRRNHASSKTSDSEAAANN